MAVFDCGRVKVVPISNHTAKDEAFRRRYDGKLASLVPLVVTEAIPFGGFIFLPQHDNLVLLEESYVAAIEKNECYRGNMIDLPGMNSTTGFDRWQNLVILPNGKVVKREKFDRMLHHLKSLGMGNQQLSRVLSKDRTAETDGGRGVSTTKTGGVSTTKTGHTALSNVSKPETDEEDAKTSKTKGQVPDKKRHFRVGTTEETTDCEPSAK